MSESKPRRPRKLLVASVGLAAVGFGSQACVGGKVAMGSVACSPGVCGTTATTGGGGTTGQGVQYCGIPDGGVPIPCDQLDGGADAGEVDGGASDAG